MPLDSPPFPNSDWSYGGSPAIGSPDTNIYPLMTAIDHAKGRTKVYGWIEPGVNFSTSSKTNFPAAYSIFPNRMDLNQTVLFMERLPDTVQTKHFDWGYHLTALYGIDYRFTIGKGYFSQQLLKFNRQYGFDPILIAADLYFPRVAQGMNVRIGRFISVPGIESQLAPGNYTFTHSLLFTVVPSTDTGIMTTIRLSRQWLVQAGFSAGHDVAPWTKDRKPTGHLCLDYTTAGNNDNFYVCANGINDGIYAYNNVQHYDATWYHRFNKNWHIATEAWYMYERGVPNVAGNVANPVQIETGANGAFCHPGQLRCTAPEYAVSNYLEKKINTNTYVSFRSEFLDDKKGQRSGYASKYTENTLMFGKWIGNTVLFRPELRLDRSWDERAYNGGKNNNQFIFVADLIYKF